MFTLTQCTPTGYDCPAEYRVDLDKGYTLQEFIDAILTNKKDEWGEIKIKNLKKKRRLASLFLYCLLVWKYYK